MVNGKRGHRSDRCPNWLYAFKWGAVPAPTHGLDVGGDCVPPTWPLTRDERRQGRDEERRRRAHPAPYVRFSPLRREEPPNSQHAKEPQISPDVMVCVEREGQVAATDWCCRTGSMIT